MNTLNLPVIPHGVRCAYKLPPEATICTLKGMMLVTHPLAPALTFDPTTDTWLDPEAQSMEDAMKSLETWRLLGFQVLFPDTSPHTSTGLLDAISK